MLLSIEISLLIKVYLHYLPGYFASWCDVDIFERQLLLLNYCTVACLSGHVNSRTDLDMKI